MPEIYVTNETEIVVYLNAAPNSTGSVPVSEPAPVHDWKNVALVALLCVIIVVTVIGNTLIITSVLTTRRLRTVTNCFVMSLAVADWLVGIFVMPPAVAFFWVGKWQLGWVLCDVWISLDVLLCTASILSLCAISVDRYLAVTQPLNYSRRRRSKRLALFMILAVWVLALAITCPPILGWYERGRTDCRYNRNMGYVVFSAMGSFFLPLLVVLYVYARISCVVATRHDRLGEMRNGDDNVQRHKSNSVKLRIEIIDTEIDTSEAESASSPARRWNHRGGTACGGDLTPGQTFKLSTTTVCECQPLNETQVTLHRTKVQNKLSSPSYRDSRMEYATTFAVGSNSPRSPFNRTRPLRQRISSLRRETKTAQTLSIVVGGFVACWLPFFIYYLLTPFLVQTDVSDQLMSILTWLGWINSAINPFIYAFYNVDFRASFWRLTIGKFRKRR